MPIETNDFLPWLDWLLGPGWHEGVLWQPAMMVLESVLGVTLIALLLSKLRHGSLSVARISGRVLAAVLASASLLGGASVGIYRLVTWLAGLPDATATGPAQDGALAADLPARFPAMVALRGALQGAAEAVFWTSQQILGAEWLQGGLYHWLLVFACAMLASIVVGWLVCAIHRGPRQAVRTVDQSMTALVTDLALISPRRVLALAWLAMKESIRRRVVVVFVVFLLVMLFAGWFINPTSDQPARLYLNFVFGVTMFLTLALALFLSALSLPADIKNRTLYTVVTKPVRQSEIVLGRILGFTAVGTVLLAAMGLISYVFTVRGLDHTHALTANDLADQTPADGKEQFRNGRTSVEKHHDHQVTLRTSDGATTAVVEPAQGHSHELYLEGSGDDATYTLGPPQGMLQARVPIYGRLHFKDREGRDTDRGISVGDEWTYRSFIYGGTPAAAIWNFHGITERRFPESEFPDGIPLELTIEVFRTHKGVVGKPVGGILWLRNPDSGLMVQAEIFGAQKFHTDVHRIPRMIEAVKTDDTGQPVKDALGKQVMEKRDFFRDLVTPDGRVEVRIQCMEKGQTFGMAQADAYFRAGDGSFAVNFAKGYLGIWMQMVLVLAFGVMFSTFLGAPVAFLATLKVIVGGLCVAFMSELATGKAIGGGPFESMYRLMTQQNMTGELESNLSTSTAVLLDQPVQWMLWVISSVLPPLDGFDFSSNMSYGFDVGGDLLMKCLLRVLGFLVPLVVAGYFFLKTREVAR